MPATDSLILCGALVALVAAVTVRGACAIALRHGLLDVPNSRSSHAQPIPRLGGAAFVPVVLLAIVVASPSGRIPPLVFAAFLIGALALFGLSLIDDFMPISSGLRLGVHLAVAAGVLATVSSAWPALLEIGAGGWAAWILPPSVGFWVLLLWVVGLLNVYNFMDGIDGIAGVQGLIAGLAWCAIGVTGAAPLGAFLGAMIAAGAFGFLTLNWPPAKIFMGDAGSTVLGYSFAMLPLLVTIESGSRIHFQAALTAGFLVVWPFCADGVFTILRRLRHRENILQAHRSHLYQRLVIAGVSHRQVTLVYGGLALVGGALAWWVAQGVPYAASAALVVILVGFVGLWMWTRRRERVASGILREGRRLPRA